MRRLGVVLALTFALAACSSGQADVTTSAARISTPIAGSAQIALSFTNAGTLDDELLTVSTPAAVFVEIHETVLADGRATMIKRDTVVLPASETVVFRPGGLHLMLLVPDDTVVKGARVPLTLTFKSSAPITIDAEVVDLLDLVAFGDGLQVTS